MNALPIAVFGLLGILVAMIIVIFMPKTCVVAKVEGFQQGTITTCPKGSKTYTDRFGNINCCVGEVDGNTCNGKVLCTFTGNAGRDYPLCTSQKLKRQPVGEIPEFIKKFAQENPRSLSIVIDIMEWGSQHVNKIPNSDLSKEMKDIYFDLLKEEKTRASQMYTLFENGQITKEELYEYQEEDITYIYNKIMTIFVKSPNLQSNPIVKEQVKQQICK